MYHDELFKGKSPIKCGTHFYLAPEIIKGLPFSEKCDVWALGVLIYEVLALKRPFQTTYVDDLHKMIVENDPEPLP